jgi:hypothetical protein
MQAAETLPVCTSQAAIQIDQMLCFANVRKSCQVTSTDMAVLHIVEHLFVLRDCLLHSPFNQQGQISLLPQLVMQGIKCL